MENKPRRQGTGTLAIESKDFSNTYPSGSAVYEPAYGASARISLLASVQANVVEDGRTVIRQAAEPTARPSGDPLKDGDIWVDTDDAYKPYIWDGNSWEEYNEKVITAVAGLEVQVGDFDTTDFQGFEDDIGTIGARSVLFTNVNGNIAEVELLSGTTGSAINISASQINISGDTTFTNGYDPSDGRVAIRQSSEPTSRPSGDDLKGGDIWIDTNDGDKPYTYNGSDFIASYTNIDGGSIVTGAIESGNFSAGSTGWQIDTNGDAEFNSITIRDSDFVNPTFLGAAVGLINTVSTKANLPASGDEDGDTYYVEDEPGGLYVWRSADSEWKDTRDGGFLLKNSISAGKIQVATLSAITADIGEANISNTLTMGSNGEITNATGDYVIDADGMSMTIGNDTAQAFVWYDGATIKGRIGVNNAGSMRFTSWDGSQVNVALTLDDELTSLLPAKFEDGLSVDGGLTVNTGDAEVPNSTTPTHALNVGTADGRYILDGTVVAGTPSGTPTNTLTMTVDSTTVQIPVHVI